MLTAIIDYSSGNLHSAQKAFEKITALNNLGSVVVTSDPKIISAADRLVLPGDGAFPSCKAELMSSEAYEAMVYGAVEKSRPFLGICVGMQLMATKSYECTSKIFFRRTCKCVGQTTLKSKTKVMVKTIQRFYMHTESCLLYTSPSPRD